MSRRHQAGAGNGRALLFTVLGEFVLPGGGSAWTSAVIDVLGRLGVEEKACRQALMRTADDGWLSSERVGRRTRWRLTNDAEQLLTEGTERIYGFHAASRDWDGRLLIVLAQVAEGDRPARHQLRTRLTSAGFGSPSPGVWISTHVDRADEVRRLLTRDAAFDDAQVFVAEHELGDLRTLVDRTWDLYAIDQRYRQFLTDFRGAHAADPLARLVELVHAWRAFPWIDPTLPSTMLPARWSGTKAARLFADRRAGWAGPARASWSEINVDTDARA